MKKKKYSYDLSIVVPAFNESRRIISTLEKIIDYIKRKKIKTEIIVVDDHSSDGTSSVVRKNFKNYRDLRIIYNERNMGKGYSVKQGVLISRGEYILFTDADNSTPIEELDKFFRYLRKDTILIGSRYKKSRTRIIKKQPLYRIILSRIANFIIKLFLSLDIEDTQCGFKLFPHEAANKLFSLQTIKRFGFDMEILSLAFLFKIKVKEIPVNWFDSVFTRIRPFKDAIITFIELLKIKKNIWTNYYQKKV